ncbi:helix-turn-helix domain-containing protein [Streptomyces sp. ATCC 21386]|uniref:MmyB family transcriptional regulator n=1 Tax=Streptomyces sp. ATCC 21386 TaxID=2699428 RepID=UPI002044D319|nr:helix-turn-helix domain-containing protein [Streptomyces sp. ATCC 21386]
MTTTSAPETTAHPRTGTPERPPAAPESVIRRHELAAFLRHRREHIAPEQVGLPRGRRRRTPGLRREEVAQLSAVGVTWYTWLEQARDIHVSGQVLDALARALLLDPGERAHLFNLAGAADPAPGTRCHTITDAQYALLEQLEPIPASIQNSRYDLLAHNRTFGLLFCDLSEVPPEDMNFMILAYTNPQWRASMVQLEETTRFLAGKLRAAMADHLTDPAWKTLLKRLRAESAEFRAAWERHEVVETFNKRKQYRNAHVGLLDVDHTDLWLGPRPGPRMVTYVPVDDETRDRMEKLHAMALEREKERERERNKEKEWGRTGDC